VAKDAARGVVDAAEDGCMQASIFAHALFQRRNPRPTLKHTHTAPHAALGRHVKDEHAKCVAHRKWRGGVPEDVPQDVAQDLVFGARAARALLATPPPPLKPYFAQLPLLLFSFFDFR